jgi:CubicO group peptidase (beta-lactamase class C family)
MTTATGIHGVCDSLFGRVKEAFAGNFETGQEVGACLSVTIDGETVVDIWAGHADPGLTRPWERDTIACTYSTTKGIVATCASRLVDQGLLDIDTPVAEYWPEFAQNGKESIPVRYLLSHQAGLPAIKDLLPAGALFDWQMVTDALARQEPWWEPGTNHGYHAMTYGFLVGEVIRRVSGKTVGAYFQDEIATPLGIEYYIGTPAELDVRIAEMIPAPLETGRDTPLSKAMMNPLSISFKAFGLTPDIMNHNLGNSSEWRRAEIPAGNGHGNARAIARVYGALARGGEIDGYRLLSSEAIERAIEEQAYGEDAVLIGLPMRVGLGFMLTCREIPLGPNPRSFGHAGMGGSLGFADPNEKLGFGYVMNKMVLPEDLNDPRLQSLVDAVYASL